jgi:hypothetical protein
VGTTSTTLALCLAAVSLNPVGDVALDRVDLAEINHHYDEQGHWAFDQIVFYEWSPADSRYHVRDWRLVKTPAQIPLRSWREGGFVAVWHDFKNRDVLRKVHARMIRETWTQYDPELVEREFLPQDRRRALSRLLAKSPLDNLPASLQPAAARTSASGSPRRY